MSVHARSTTRQYHSVLEWWFVRRWCGSWRELWFKTLYSCPEVWNTGWSLHQNRIGDMHCKALFLWYLGYYTCQRYVHNRPYLTQSWTNWFSESLRHTSAVFSETRRRMLIRQDCEIDIQHSFGQTILCCSIFAAFRLCLDIMWFAWWCCWLLLPFWHWYQCPAEASR